ncbi:MAG: lipopolysaccharide transport periplasmic protein LptA, partial [Proteobacteria bacterium]|nr:lipopolysaccharide transport periplasmic protein LptA [Pseudomonadota bacterium]
LLLLPLIFNPFQSLAEKADREKPINIESDSGYMDDKTSTAVFKGNVVLTQGTLLIKADTLTVLQENDEFKQGIALGELAYFRQKREGYKDYIEGEAKRIEFDAITDQLTMVDSAKLWRDGDQVEGKFIHYDAVTETFTVRSDGGNKDARNPSNGRVKVIIQPKQRVEP